MLNEHHRRRLTVRLGRLVQEGQELVDRLRKAQAEAAGDPDPALAALISEIQALLGSARTAAARLGVSLAAPPSDLRHHVQVWSAAWWTRVLDCRPEHLRGLGELEPGDESRIAPVIDQVAGHLARLQRLASGSRDAED
jgi:hypothetical protein